MRQFKPGQLQTGSLYNISASYAVTASYANNFTVSGSINGVDWIDFDTSASAVQPTTGRLSWNNTDGTLDLGLKGGNVTLQIGQENVIRVVNKSGGDLLEANFQVVRVRSVAEGGAQGQRLAVVLAQADNDADSATTLGIVTETITNNQEGFITIFGQVRGIDTTGAKSYGGLETWVDGDMLYLSPYYPGYLTNVKPTAPNHLVIIGYVEYAHQNNGKIFVKIDNGWELGELHDVRDLTTSASYGDLLTKSGSVWTNSKQLTGSYGLTGSLTATSLTASSALVNGNVQILGTASIAYLNVQYETASIIYSSGSNQFGDAANDTQTLWGTVDVKTGPLLVTGSVRSTSGFTGSFSGSVAAPGSTTQIVYNNGGVLDANSGFAYSGSNVGIGTIPSSYRLDISGSFRLRPANTTAIISFENLGSAQSRLVSDSNFAIWNSGSETVRFLNGGNVGIGASSPTSRLQVRGSGTTSATTALLVENSSAASRLTILDDGTSAFNTNHLYISSSGFIGVRTLSPVASDEIMTLRLDRDSGTVLSIVNATNSTNARSSLRVGVPGAAINVASYPASASNALLANRGAILTDSTVANGIVLTTSIGPITLRPGNTSGADLLTATGSFIGIGTSTPSASLHISGASSATLFEIDSPTLNNIMFVSGSGRLGFNITSSLNAQATFNNAGSSVLSEINTYSNGTYGFRTNGYVKAVNWYLYSSTGNIANSNGVSLIHFDASNNIGIGVSSSLSAKTTIRGTGTTSSTTALRVENTNASASLVVLDNGYVGIGESSPSYRLQFNGGMYQAGTNFISYFDGATRFGGTNSYSTAILNNGRVGIGTTTPSASLHISGSNPLLKLNGSGSELMSVDGASGRLFTVSDDLSNSLFSVNTISGLPVIEAFATNDVYLGKYNTYPIKTIASGTLAVITGSISGSVIGTLTGTSSFASTSSYLNTLNQDLAFNGNLTLNGTASISNLIINQIAYSSGSNQLGDAADDTQTLYGTVVIPTGSLTLTGSFNSRAFGSDNFGYTTRFVSQSNQNIFVSGVGWIPLWTTGSLIGEYLNNGGYEYTNGMFSGSVLLTSLGDLPIKVRQAGTFQASNSGLLNISVTDSDSTAIGGSQMIQAQMQGTLMTGSSTEQYSFNINQSPTLNTIDLNIRKDNNIGDSIYLNLNDGSTGFSIYNTLPLTDPTYLFKVYRSSNATYGGDGSPIFTIFQNRIESNIPITGSFTGSVASPGSDTQIVYNNGGVLGADSGFVYSGSRVGIGTTTPSESLEVQGSILIEGSGGRLRLAADIGTQFSLGSGWNGIQDTMFIASSLLTPRIATFQSDGKIGIGTILPSASLHISGASSAALLQVDSPASSSILFVSGSGRVGFGTNAPTQRVDIDGNVLVRLGNSIYFRDTTSYIYEASGLNIVSGATRNLRLNAGGSDRLFVSASGLVGIGTTSPSYSLDVSGSTYSRRVLVGNDVGYLAGADFYHRGTNSGAHFMLRDVNNNNTFYLTGASGTSQIIAIPVNIGLGTSTLTSTNRVTIRGLGATSATTALLVENSNASASLTITDNRNSQFFGNVGIQRVATASLDVAGTTRISGSFNTAASGSILTVIGSGSAQPIFTVQGSQGELFSITDSLSGSLFSVNDISGLPILEVFSDNTTLIGNYQDPMLITTTKLVTTASGAFTIYALPTASYDTAFFEYSIRSGSDARAGTIMAMQLGTTVNFTETTTTDFGSTSGFRFAVQVSGANMILTGSATTSGWTIKTIVRGL